MFELVPFTTQQIWSLYDALIELAETGDETAIVAMNKLEMHYVDLIIREPGKGQKIYKLIVSEYLPDENAEVIIANSRMIGSAIRSSKDNIHTYSILLISSKNQYIFKLSSKDRREMMQFKDVLNTIAKSLVETGEIYKATGENRKNIGLAFLLKANENGFLSIGKDA